MLELLMRLFMDGVGVLLELLANVEAIVTTMAMKLAILVGFFGYLYILAVLHPNTPAQILIGLFLPSLAVAIVGFPGLLLTKMTIAASDWAVQ
jgi:hypothetical protein